MNNAIEIDFDNCAGGWHNIKQSFWFAKRIFKYKKAFKTAFNCMFDFQMNEDHIFIHFIAMQIYIKR